MAKINIFDIATRVIHLFVFINFVSYDKFLFNQMIILGNKR